MVADFHWKVRVYYEDTDAGGVVFYANYLKFFERARTEWLRARAVGQHELTRQEGVLFVVKGTSVDYHAPARLDDELKVTVVVERLGLTSVQFSQQAWRLETTGETLLCSSRIKVGCIDGGSFRPCRIPDRVLEKIRTGANLERGQKN